MMDGSHIGRFGTLSVMKTSEPTVPVAHFPIDEEEVTIGRDPSCSIRLYYETVSRLHCKITFQERKAFLVVLGLSGLTADGCQIFPTASGPTTVPLGNESEVEVHRKIFRFTYPPKELRAVLLSTPEPDRTRRRRTLRMSMIQSAQVFSPAPSNDPQENLRTLQSPIKPRFPSPLKPSTSASVIDEGEEEEEVIVLVDGNQPSVFQDDEDDLVILENVQAPPAPANNPMHTEFSQPTQQYQTPHRKPRNSLHRAVLIRSAQRAVRTIELETEEAREEREVEEAVAALEDERTTEQAEQLGNNTPDNQEQEQEDVLEEVKPRQLGPFMTPQAAGGQSVHDARARLGHSVEGPRRVRIVQPWRVQDVVVPADNKVKKEDFAPVFRKISAEERLAIRERRRSALKVPDPADAQIPGSRKMSFVAPPPSAVFSSPEKAGLSAVAEESKAGIREEEDTAVLINKMKAMVEDIKRRKSMGASLSPMKADAESAFWGSGARSDKMVEDDSVVQHDYDMSRLGGGDATAATSGRDEDGELATDEAELEQPKSSIHGVSSRTLSTKTPRMEGMRHMFAEPKEPRTPAFGGIKRLFYRDQLSTPAYVGIKDMLKTSKAEMTPQVGGFRDMFNIREEASTPTFEGIGEMLTTPVGYGTHIEKDTVDAPIDVDEGEQTGDEEPKTAAVVHRRKGVQGRKRLESVSPEPTAPRKVLRNTKPPSHVAVSLPRTTRTKKEMTEDQVTSKVAPRSEPPRKSKSVEVGADENIMGTARRATRKVLTTGTSTSLLKPQGTRQTRTQATAATLNESGSEDEDPKTTKAPSTTARRSARTKSVSVAVSGNTEDGNDKAVPTASKVKRSGRGKRAETIKEEEETAVLDDRMPAKKGHSSSRTPSKASDSLVDKGEKENTPDVKVDGDESAETATPPPSAPPKATRARKAVAKTPTVKDESKETKVVSRTRVTRSRK